MKSSTLCWGITKGIVLLKQISIRLAILEIIASPLQQQQLSSFFTLDQFPPDNKWNRENKFGCSRPQANSDNYHPALFEARIHDVQKVHKSKSANKKTPGARQ